MTRDITILVPGELHERALARLNENFQVAQVGSVEASEITADIAEQTRGIATSFFAIDAGLIDCLPKLEIIANFGVGYDKVDAKHAAMRQVMVTNTPDVLTEEVADTALGLLINTVREFPRAEAWLRDGRWEKEGPYRLTPGTLRGRKVGIFGMGRIGQAIARRIEAFGLPVSYHNRRAIEGSPYTYLRDAGRTGRSGRYADQCRALDASNGEGDRRLRPQGTGAEWRVHQYRSRLDGGRSGPDRGAGAGRDPGGRARRVRERTACARAAAGAA
jgi:hypothetical protein